VKEPDRARALPASSVSGRCDNPTKGLATAVPAELGLVSDQHQVSSLPDPRDSDSRPPAPDPPMLSARTILANALRHVRGEFGVRSSPEVNPQLSLDEQLALPPRSPAADHLPRRQSRRTAPQPRPKATPRTTTPAPRPGSEQPPRPQPAPDRRRPQRPLLRPPLRSRHPPHYGPEGYNTGPNARLPTSRAVLPAPWQPSVPGSHWLVTVTLAARGARCSLPRSTRSPSWTDDSCGIGSATVRRVAVVEVADRGQRRPAL
jgi:hypothetical protein